MTKVLLFIISIVTFLVVLAAGLVWYLSSTTELTR